MGLGVGTHWCWVFGRSDIRRYSDIRRLYKTNPVIILHRARASPNYGSNLARIRARASTPIDDDASTVRHARDRASGDFGTFVCSRSMGSRARGGDGVCARREARSRDDETDECARASVYAQVRAFATGAAPKSPAGKPEVTVRFMSRRVCARGRRSRGRVARERGFALDVVAY